MTSQTIDFVEICKNCAEAREPMTACAFEDIENCPIIKVVKKFAAREEPDWSGGIGPK